MSSGQRRPYRVVFTRPGPAGNDPRRATIVAADIAVARREARHIAASGGTAEVHYISDTGERRTVETYDAMRPEPHPLPAGQRPAM